VVVMMMMMMMMIVVVVMVMVMVMVMMAERCRMARGAESNCTESYFFAHKDKKYTTGMRTNRATKEGFWKATGRDKPVFGARFCGQQPPDNVIGMRKTLVFYRGRAPRGVKSNWIMHEFRLTVATRSSPSSSPSSSSSSSLSQRPLQVGD
jgi:hypothetical protein